MKIKQRFITSTTVIILLVLVSAFILRVANLNKYDLWFDELVSNEFTVQSISTISDFTSISNRAVILDRIKNDPHSSLYYLAVYAYSSVFGDGKSLRGLSVIFSLLALIAFYFLARQFFDRQTSVCALILMAFNPFHIWYAQEARAYTMTCFLSLLAIYTYVQALRKNKFIHWIYFSILSILAIFSSYNAVLLIVVTSVALIFPQYRQSIWKWSLSMAVIFLVIVISYSVSFQQLQFVLNSFWIPSPSKELLLHTWMFYTLGYTATLNQFHIALSLYLIVFIIGVYSYFRVNWSNTILLLLFLLLPIFMTYILSKTIVPIYIHRQLFIFSPFYYLFIANGIMCFRYKEVRVLISIAIMVLLTISVFQYHDGYMIYDGNNSYRLAGVFKKKNYNELFMQMNEEFKKGDFIAAADLQSYVMSRPYVDGRNAKYITTPSKMFGLFAYPEKLDNYDKRFLAVDELVKNISPEIVNKLHNITLHSNGKLGIDKMELNNGKIKRVWLISSNWQKFEPAGESLNLIRKDLARFYVGELLNQNDGVQIELYVKN